MPRKLAKLQPTAAQVEQGIREVRVFYRLGRESLERSPERGQYAKGQIDAEAKARKVNADTLRKARAFAGLYGKPDLDELFGLCRKHQFAPGKSFVLRLVTLPLRRERRALQREAVAGHWTMSRFDQELNARYGARRSGGRIKAIPPDKAGLLAQIEMMCEEWKRWYAALQREPKVGAKKAREADLSPRIKQKVQDVLKQLDELQWSVGNALNREMPTRIPRAATGIRRPKAGGSTLEDDGWTL